jgi:tetratricopeptide (TPR) repeat protein
MNAGFGRVRCVGAMKHKPNVAHHRLALGAVLCALSVWSACIPPLEVRDPSSHAPAQSGLSAQQALQVAQVLERSGDSSRASQYLTLALRLGADEHAVVPRLLRLYVRDGQYRLAVELAESYVRRHPNDRRTRLLLGTLYTGVGFDGLAERQYERVLAQDPKSDNAHFALASLLRARGQDFARADQHFRAYLQLAPSGAHAEEARAALLTELP